MMLWPKPLRATALRGERDRHLRWRDEVLLLRRRARTFDAGVTHVRQRDQGVQDLRGWLLPRTGGIDVTPTLPVADMDKPIRFYEAAGFDIERYDDGFAFIRFGDQSVFDVDLDPSMHSSTNHAGCYIITADTRSSGRLFVGVDPTQEYAPIEL